MQINYCKQRSDEWFQLKWGLLGGSGTKEFMTPSKKAHETNTFFKLLQQNCEDINLDLCGGFISKEAERGHAEEPFACKAVRKHLIANGIVYQSFRWEEVGLITNKKYKYLGLSPDRVNFKIDDSKTALEVKCPSGHTHAKWVSQSDTHQIPVEHVWQIVMYFTIVEDLNTMYWGSYRRENKRMPLYLVELNKDSLINIGTEKKPVMVRMEEAVEVLLSKYWILEKAIDEQLG